MENNFNYGENFQKHVIDFLEILNNISINFMKQYLEIYVKMILNTSDVEGYILFNHMIQRFIYFIDTKCYTNEFNIKFDLDETLEIKKISDFRKIFEKHGISDL